MKQSKRVGLYMRVSTKDQSCEMQLSDLERYSRPTKTTDSQDPRNQDRHLVN